MFRAPSAHLQEDTVAYMQHMVLSLSMRVPGGLSVHSLRENWLLRGRLLKTPYQQPSPYSKFSLKLCTDRPPRTLKESDSTICCMYRTVSFWRWALEVRNM